jgi:hypothetical protein
MDALNKAVKKTRGFKTFAVAVLMVVLAGLKAQGYINDEHVDIINMVLMALGFSALRLSMPRKK